MRELTPGQDGLCIVCWMVGHRTPEHVRDVFLKRSPPYRLPRAEVCVAALVGLILRREMACTAFSPRRRRG